MPARIPAPRRPLDDQGSHERWWGMTKGTDTVIPVATIDHIPGYRVTSSLGVCSGSCMAYIGRTLTPDQALSKAIVALAEGAKEGGADAVVGLAYQVVNMGGLHECLFIVTGTAVKLTLQASSP